MIIYLTSRGIFDILDISGVGNKGQCTLGDTTFYYPCKNTNENTGIPTWVITNGNPKILQYKKITQNFHTTGIVPMDTTGNATSGFNNNSTSGSIITTPRSSTCNSRPDSI